MGITESTLCVYGKQQEYSNKLWYTCFLLEFVCDVFLWLVLPRVVALLYRWKLCRAAILTMCSSTVWVASWALQSGPLLHLSSLLSVSWCWGSGLTTPHPATALWRWTMWHHQRKGMSPTCRSTVMKTQHTNTLKWTPAMHKILTSVSSGLVNSLSCRLKETSQYYCNKDKQTSMIKEGIVISKWVKGDIKLCLGDTWKRVTNWYPCSERNIISCSLKKTTLRILVALAM